MVTALEENSRNATENKPNIEIAQEEGVIDVDSDDSNYEVTGRFLHLQEGY